MQTVLVLYDYVELHWDWRVFLFVCFTCQTIVRFIQYLSFTWYEFQQKESTLILFLAFNIWHARNCWSELSAAFYLVHEVMKSYMYTFPYMLSVWKSGSDVLSISKMSFFWLVYLISLHSCWSLTRGLWYSQLPIINRMDLKFSL